MSFPISNTPAPGLFTTPIDGGGGVKPLLQPPGSGGPGFAELVGQAIEKVNETQAAADNSIKKFMTGEETEIHQVMLQMEQARLSMMMAVEVRNKTVEAYQEISRMPL